MKRNIYILFTIGLFIRILPSHSVNLNTERLSNLKRLIENNIAYDSIAPIDSVIAWGLPEIITDKGSGEPPDRKRERTAVKAGIYSA